MYCVALGFAAVASVDDGATYSMQSPLAKFVAVMANVATLPVVTVIVPIDEGEPLHAAFPDPLYGILFTVATHEAVGAVPSTNDPKPLPSASFVGIVVGIAKGNGP